MHVFRVNRILDACKRAHLGYRYLHTSLSFSCRYWDSVGDNATVEIVGDFVQCLIFFQRIISPERKSQKPGLDERSKARERGAAMQYINRLLRLAVQEVNASSSLSTCISHHWFGRMRSSGQRNGSATSLAGTAVLQSSGIRYQHCT